MRFPNLHKVVNDFDLLAYTNYAIVEEGKIIVNKDAHLMVYSDFGQFVVNPEKAEGRIFNKDLLKWMANKKWTKIECFDNFITADSNKISETRSYSGYINFTRNNEITERNVVLQVEDRETEYGTYPDWKSVIPSDKIYIESKGLKAIGLSSKYISLLMDCFSTVNDNLKFEFWEDDKLIRISPTIQCEGYLQEAILTPRNLEIR